MAQLSQPYVLLVFALLVFTVAQNSDVMCRLVKQVSVPWCCTTGAGGDVLLAVIAYSDVVVALGNVAAL